MIKLNSRVVLDGACYDDYDDLSIFEHVEGKQNEGDVILLISDHPIQRGYKKREGVQIFCDVRTDRITYSSSWIAAIIHF